MKKRAFVIVAAVLTALSLRADQKNVQLLTNMSDVQLQRTMNMIRASLGVHCDYCHVVDDKDGWQFARDDKQEKKTAREMIAMVMKINKGQFNDRPEISCWTCHRGTTHPASLVPLPQTLPPFPTPKAERPALPALADVVKKYADAVGDAARLQKPRTMKGSREGTDGKATPIEVQEAPGRWHIVSDTPAGRVEQVVTEAGGWSKDAKGVRQFPATGVENFQELAAALAPTLPSAIPPGARVVGKEKIGDHGTVIVAARAGDRARQRLYFDTTTGLLVRRVLTVETPIGLVPTQSDFDDWRDAGGAKFPFTVRTSLVDPWVGSTRRYTEVKLDAAIDDRAFAKPE